MLCALSDAQFVPSPCPSGHQPPQRAAARPERQALGSHFNSNEREGGANHSDLSVTPNTAAERRPVAAQTAIGPWGHLGGRRFTHVNPLVSPSKYPFRPGYVETNYLSLAGGHPRALSTVEAETFNPRRDCSIASDRACEIGRYPTVSRMVVRPSGKIVSPVVRSSSCVHQRCWTTVAVSTAVQPAVSSSKAVVRTRK